MRHRIFIASYLPDDLKKIFLDYQQRKLSNSNFRLVSEQALHLTLIFIGYVNGDDILKINEVCKYIFSLFSPIDVKLDKITFGSNLRSNNPIWAKCEVSKHLNNLYKNLENKLIDQGISFRIENHLFRPHITLARFKNEAKILDLSGLEEKINKSFVINSISVIESELNNIGPKYTNLATYALKANKNLRFAQNLVSRFTRNNN